MVTALTVTPALSVLLLSTAPLAGRHGSMLMGLLQQLYDRVFGPTRCPPVVAGALVAAAVLVGVGVWSQLERTMVPSFKETDVLVDWQSAPGTSLQAMNRVTSALMRDLRAIPGVRNTAAHVGRALLSPEVADVNAAEVWISIDPSVDHDATLAAIQGTVDTYPGVDGKVETYLSKKMREALTGGEDTVTVRVYGHDPEIIRAKAEEIRGVLSKIDGIENPRVELQDDATTIQVEVDLDKAASHDLKPGDVRRATSALMAGITVGALFEEQKVFDVVVWADPKVRNNLSDVENLLIDTESGDQVRLADVAHVRTAPAMNIIRRQGVSRYIDIDADVRGQPLGAVMSDVARRIKDVAFPFEYHAQVLGEYVERRAALGSVYGYLAAAAILILLLLQAALGNWRLAALSIVGMPVAVLGGLLAIYLGGGVFSLGSLLGLVTVLGLTVRNDIMMVRHFQHLEHREGQRFGDPLVIRGVRERFPSIIATAITTGLLVLPFVVLGDVAGLEIAHATAVVVLGGLVTSTLQTLVVLPALYLRLGAGTATDALGLTPDTEDAGFETGLSKGGKDVAV